MALLRTDSSSSGSSSRLASVAAAKHGRTTVPSASHRTAAPPPMAIAVKQKLVGALAKQLAVVGMRAQRPLVVPVGNHAERKAPPEKRPEVPAHRLRLAGVGRSRVMEADEHRPH